MEYKWKKYYSEIFKTYTSELFSKLWGRHIDEYGEYYEDVYKYELEERKEDFAEYMYLFNKYSIKYNRNAIAIYLIHIFEGLGSCDNPNGAYEIADNIIQSINDRVGFNDAWHPEGNPILFD